MCAPSRGDRVLSNSWGEGNIGASRGAHRPIDARHLIQSLDIYLPKPAVSDDRAAWVGARRGDAMTDENNLSLTEDQRSEHDRSRRPCACEQRARADEPSGKTRSPKARRDRRPAHLHQRGAGSSASLLEPHPLHAFFDQGRRRHARRRHRRARHRQHPPLTGRFSSFGTPR